MPIRYLPHTRFARANKKAGSGSAPFVAQYQAVYDEFLVKPSDADAAAQDTFVTALVDADIWSRLDRLWILAAHSSGVDALLDWIHPTGEVATLVNAPAFTQYEGYISTGSEYINTNFDPAADRVHSAFNDSCIFSYALSKSNDALRADCGLFDGSNWATFIRETVGSTTSQMNNQDAEIHTVLTGGMTLHDYRGILSTDSYIYHNGIYQDNGAVGSGNYPTGFNMSILVLNNHGAPLWYSAKKIALIGTGGSLDNDLKDSSRQLIFYNAFQALMTHYGTAV